MNTSVERSSQRSASRSRSCAAIASNTRPMSVAAVDVDSVVMPFRLPAVHEPRKDRTAPSWGNLLIRPRSLGRCGRNRLSGPALDATIDG